MQLRMFVLIVSVHLYTAQISLHAISCIERTLSNRMNNYSADSHCYSFAWIYRSWTSVTPIFYGSFLVPILMFSEKMKKRYQYHY